MNETAKNGVRLAHRGAVRISGQDRVAFMQGIVSNDVTKASEHGAVYAALLTPQGKFLHDLFILADGESFLIDCERADDLLRRLAAYKLRAKVVLEHTDLEIWAFPTGGYEGPHGYADPRLPSLGQRAFIATGTLPDGMPIDTYDTLRLKSGVPDGSRDMEIEKSTLAEGHFGALNGIDWKKGCYVGQELTARMQYRGLVKKALFPVTLSPAPMAYATSLTFDGAEGATLRSHCGDVGLALIPIKALRKALAQQEGFIDGNKSLMPALPDWLILPENKL